MVLVTLLDLASHISAKVPKVDPGPGQKSGAVEKVWEMPPAARWLLEARQREVFRTMDCSEIFPPNYGDAWGIEEAMGSSATGLVRYFEFRGTGWGPGSNASALLNLRYFASRTPVAGMPKVFGETDAVYRNPRAVPRAFVARRYRTFADDRAMLDWIQSPLFAPLDTVVIDRKELERLPAWFVAGAEREGEQFRELSTSHRTAAERERETAKDPEQVSLLTNFSAPWGWSPGDDLSFLVRPAAPAAQAYLVVEYSPVSPEDCRVEVRRESAHGTGAFDIVLPARTPGGGPEIDRLFAAEPLGPLAAEEELRISLRRGASCGANLESVRVASAPPAADSASSPGTVSVTSFRPNRIRLSTSLARPGFVVVSEVYYPGWRAWVDGQPVPVLAGDYILRAIPVPAGRHEVVLRFRSTPFLLGLAVSAGTLLLGAGLVFLKRSS
jgi:hypothetical protein